MRNFAVLAASTMSTISEEYVSAEFPNQSLSLANLFNALTVAAEGVPHATKPLEQTFWSSISLISLE